MYGDYDGPNKADKGEQGGSCNRTRCQASPANYWNHGSYSWYCAGCALDIGQDHVNLRRWMSEHYPKVGHAMFETKEQMLAREANMRGTTLAEIAEQTKAIRIARREQIRHSTTRVDAVLEVKKPRRFEPKKPARKRKMIRH